MKRQLLFYSSLFIYLVFSIQLISENGKLSGYITNKDTGQPVPDANIIIEGTPLGTASQSNGFYFIDHLNIPDTIDVTVQVIGFEKETKKDILIEKNTKLNFKIISKLIQFDPIFFTGNRFNHLQSNVTVSSEIINTQRMNELNGCTAGEMLESCGSTIIKDYGSYAGLKSISIRGSSSEQVLVLLDGQRMNSSHDGGIDLNTFPVSNIEKIEIIKGGHSALYGSDAIGGIISLFSKDQKPEKEFNYKIQSTIGSFGTYNNNIFGLHGIGPVQLSFNLGQMHSDGDFSYEDPVTKGDSLRKNNHYNLKNIFIQAKTTINSNNKIQLTHQTLNTKRGVAGTISYPSPAANRTEERHLTIFKSDNQISDKITLSEQMFYQEYDNHYINRDPFFPSDDIYKNNSYGLNISGTWNPNSILFIIAGGEYKQDQLNTSLYKNRKRENHSLFIQTEITQDVNFYRLKSQWRLVPALRWDKYSDIAEHLSPKCGAMIKIQNGNDIILKANIGQAFRAPTFNDLYWPEYISAWGGERGNPNLKPEVSTEYDIGFQYVINQSSQMKLGITYFNNNIENLIIWDFSPAWILEPKNVPAHISGIENEFSFRSPENRFYFSTSQTWLKTIDKTPRSINKGNELIYRPQMKYDVTVGLNISIFSFNMNYRYIGKRRYFDWNLNQYTYLPDYDILNTNITCLWMISKMKVKAELQIFNLYNNYLTFMQGYPLPGREFRFSVGFEY